MALVILTQRSWSPDATAALEAPIAALRHLALRKRPQEEPVLVLLPQAAAGSSLSRVPQGALLSAIAKLCRSTAVYLAGSAIVSDEISGEASIVAFLVGSSGELLLRTPKISPELVQGFDDLTCEMGVEAPFAVVATPFGQVGLLPGEDILFASYARALAFHGAELILNPSQERADALFESRRLARLGRAGENSCFVATASPAHLVVNGETFSLPAATALHAFDGTTVPVAAGADWVHIDLDLELLREARVNPHRSLPALVRANLFEHGFRRAVVEAQTRARASGAPLTARPRTTREWWQEAEARRAALEPAQRRDRAAPVEERYEALIVQDSGRHVPLDRAIDARAIIQKNLDDSLALAGSRANVPTVRLVVFPEFWLTGPGGIGAVQRTVQDMERLAITYPDPVFDQIGAFAQRHHVYVAFQNFEVHPKLPHRVFNSAFLINDSGDLVHTYRKIQCADVWGLLPDATPGSIFSQCLDVFGERFLFPVADTPLGRLANMICFDNMVPEVAQGLRRAGAEIILHSSSEPHGAGREVWDALRRLHAFDNTCYVLSAINGAEHVSHDSERLTFFRRGHSKIIRFDGRVEGTADGPGPVAFRVNVDLGALRRARANPLANLALWDDPIVYARHYAGDIGLANDLWAEHPLVNPYEGAKHLRARIESYLARGLYVAPKSQAVRASIPDSV
jgi:predicted amidohydrolase